MFAWFVPGIPLLSGLEAIRFTLEPTLTAVRPSIAPAPAFFRGACSGVKGRSAHERIIYQQHTQVVNFAAFACCMGTADGFSMPGA